MEDEVKRQMSDTLAVGFMLAMAGGFLDVYTYMTRGGVFANAQTGNIVFMGIRLAEGRFLVAASYLVPILSFLAGVMVAEHLRGRFTATGRIHWRQVVLLAEILILAAVAFIPSGAADIWVNSAVSFVSSLQTHGFQKMVGAPVATTMCTGNLKHAGAAISLFLKRRERTDMYLALRYAGLIVSFIIGAVCAVPLTGIMGCAAVLVCCIVMLLVFALMAKKSV